MAKESRVVGRPRTFDENVVVDQAVATFWKHGGTNATMRVLERELGLLPASIYNAFGSKRELLTLALERYLDQVADQLLAPVGTPSAGCDELGRFVEAVRDWVTDPEHPGCMLLNLLAEEPADDEVLGFADRHRDGIRSALMPALARIDESHARWRANLLVAGVIGMSVAARGGADEREMADFASALHQQIQQWDAR